MSSLVLRHLEILDDRERQNVTKWSALMLSSALFLVIVQIPLSIKYFMQIRRDPTGSGHLLKRVYAFPLISFPAFYYGNLRVERELKSLSQKYFQDMNDYELDNFETLYAQRKQAIQGNSIVQPTPMNPYPLQQPGYFASAVS